MSPAAVDDGDSKTAGVVETKIPEGELLLQVSIKAVFIVTILFLFTIYCKVIISLIDFRLISEIVKY